MQENNCFTRIMYRMVKGKGRVVGGSGDGKEGTDWEEAGHIDWDQNAKEFRFDLMDKEKSLLN